MHLENILTVNECLKGNRLVFPYEHNNLWYAVTVPKVLKDTDLLNELYLVIHGDFKSSLEVINFIKEMNFLLPNSHKENQ